VCKGSVGHNDIISSAMWTCNLQSQVLSENIICKTCNVRLDIKKGSMENPSTKASKIQHMGKKWFNMPSDVNYLFISPIL
jgi:hypothetical protein